MFKITAAAAIAVCFVYDVAIPPGSTRTDELGGQREVAKTDRLPAISVSGQCQNVVWPYYPSECLKRARLPGAKPMPMSIRQVRFVTTDRPPEITEVLSFAQLEQL
jgi:hypothetical protein